MQNINGTNMNKGILRREGNLAFNGGKIHNYAQNIPDKIIYRSSILTKEPLKDSYTRVTFKGFSLPVNRVNGAFKYYGKLFGKSAETYALESLGKLEKHFPDLKIKDGARIFPEKSFSRGLWDSIIYPVTKMPLDIINFIVDKSAELFARDKNLSNKIRENIPLLGNLLKKRKQALSLDRELSSLRGIPENIIATCKEAADSLADKYTNATGKKLSKAARKELTESIALKFEEALTSDKSNVRNNILGQAKDQLKQAFGHKSTPEETSEFSKILDDIEESIRQDGQKGLDLYRGKLSAVTERVAGRIASGTTSAFFIANDMYNLTRLCKDEHQEAKKEKKKRFNQELKRVGLTAYLTLVSLGALKKLTNRSLGWALGIGLGTILVSETVGRILSGVKIFPMTKEEAIKLAKKEESKKGSKNTDTNTQKNSDTISQEKPAKPSAFKGEAKKEKREGKAGKFIAVFFALAAGGFALSKIKNTNFAKKLVENTERFYKKIVEKESPVTKKRFDEITQTLNEYGLNGEATWLKDIVYKHNQKDGKLAEKFDFGTVNTKARPFVDSAIIFPLKVFKGLLSLPYKITIKLPAFIYENGFKKCFNKLFEKPKKNSPSVNSINKAIQYLDKNLNNRELIREKLMSSMDVSSRTQYETNTLGNWMKFCGTAITGIFLSLDSYNLVMKKTWGKEKDFAYEKGKERAVQEVRRNVFSSYIVKVFNDTLKNLYNTSVLGMSAIIVTNVAFYEWLTRKSAAQPVGECSKDEILDMERKVSTQKGFWGKCYRTMQYMSGKKSLSTRLNEQDTTPEGTLYAKNLKELRFTKNPVFAAFQNNN